MMPNETPVSVRPMKTPRNTDQLISEIYSLTRSIDESRKMSNRYPNDWLMELTTQHDQERKQQLLKELHLSLSLYLYHSH